MSRSERNHQSFSIGYFVIVQIVKQFILEFVSPISVHHGTNLMAAVAVVWHDRRNRGGNKKVGYIYQILVYYVSIHNCGCWNII